MGLSPSGAAQEPRHDSHDLTHRINRYFIIHTVQWVNGDRFQPGDGAFGTAEMGQSGMNTFIFFHFIFNFFICIKEVDKNIQIQEKSVK